MRYKATGVVLALVALIATGYTSVTERQGTAPKLAYINSAVIIEQTPGTSEAQATFDREMARWRTEVQALADTLQEMISRYEQQQIMLSPDKRQERQQQILQKRSEYNQRLEELQLGAQRRQQELVQPIFDRISQVLTDIRNEESYTMIFDVAAGALIAADTTLDITQTVIERLKTQEPEQAANPS